MNKMKMNAYVKEFSKPEIERKQSKRGLPLLPPEDLASSSEAPLSMLCLCAMYEKGVFVMIH